MSDQHTYKMVLAYDGTHFGGWQVQPNAITVQKILQETFFIILKETTYVTGAGRTDAGVHALGQAAHFSTSNPADLFKLFASLNGILPKDIRVKHIEPVPADFHARYSAKRKIYRYHLTLGPVANPFTRYYSWHISAPFDRQAAQEAAKQFIGTHDFRSFANIGYHNELERDTVRTIYRLDCIPTTDGLALEFEGNGFLYKMVRNIVGCIVEVAKGQRKETDIPSLLAASDRRATGQAAPAHGLFLVEVNYTS